MFQMDPVGGPHDIVTIEDDEKTLQDLHGHDHCEEPEREFMTTIRTIDALRKKLFQHGSSFSDRERPRREARGIEFSPKGSPLALPLATN